MSGCGFNEVQDMPEIGRDTKGPRTEEVKRQVRIVTLFNQGDLSPITYHRGCPIQTALLQAATPHPSGKIPHASVNSKNTQIPVCNGSFFQFLFKAAAISPDLPFFGVAISFWNLRHHCLSKAIVGRLAMTLEARSTTSPPLDQDDPS